VIQASDRGKDLIAKLMTFSRREPLTMLSIDLTALVSEAGQALRRMLPDNVEVTVEVEPGPISVSADAGALHQILLNFGTNARDAMPGGGSFTITLRRVSVGEIQASVHGLPGGAYARLDARDTGQGMDEATRRRVFEPLFTTKPPGKGTGLGLATVYGLVKQHRGFVEVASEVGRGTTFSVYLPLLRPEAEPVAEQVAAVRVPVRGGKETVLIAEDEEGIRRAAQRALEKLGYRVLIAADGEKALELCRRHRGEIALVVSDNSMPRITGEQLLSTLRGEGDEVRFLLVSGLESQPGATQYPRVRSITKPWTLEELARAVRAALDA
jgi:CheY-like chemotaxis protein